MQMCQDSESSVSLASAYQDEHNYSLDSWYNSSVPIVISRTYNNSMQYIPENTEISLNLQWDRNMLRRCSSTVPGVMHASSFPINSSSLMIDVSDYNQRLYGGTIQPLFQRRMLEELQETLLGSDDEGPLCPRVACENHTESEWSIEESNKFNEFLESSQSAVPETNDSSSEIVQQNDRNFSGSAIIENMKKLKREVQKEPQVCSSGSGGSTSRDVQESDNRETDVKWLLIECAKAIANNSDADSLFEKLKPVVNIFGNPMQRLGAYLMEGLIARLQLSGGRIYKSLKCNNPTGPELLSFMGILYNKLPYFRFGYMAANGAIAEAFKGKDRVHIIDFQIAQGSQWQSLIQALSARPGGVPHVRITGVDDVLSQYARGKGLDVVGEKLALLAQNFNVPFQFHHLPGFASDVTADMLEIHPGETLAINFPLLLHHMPDESVSTENHRDRLLRMVKSLHPDVVTLVEQEANTNTSPFFPRFMETLNYYNAVFEALDEVMPRDSKERVNVEQHCLARDIVNVIACEGADRVERHEPFGKWRSRLTMAGFRPYSLNSHVNNTIKALLLSYNEKYRLLEKDEALYLGWLDRPLIVASAWK